jgi:hypothetical protein
MLRELASSIDEAGGTDQLLDEMSRVLDSIYAHFVTSTINGNTGGRS